MKLIFARENSASEEVLVFGRPGPVAFGPQFVGIAEDFELEDKLQELGDKMDTSDLSFLVVAADEYRTDSQVTQIEDVAD